MWDCAGSLSESLRRAMPTLELSESNPSKVQLNNPKTGLSVYFQTTSILVNSGINPNSKNVFATETDLLTGLIINALQVKSFKRIGNRTKFVKKFPDAASASIAVQQFATKNNLKIDLFCNPNDLLAKKAPTEFHLRFEDGVGGITVLVRTTSLKSQLDPQYSELFSQTDAAQTLFFVELDFDIFTVGPIDSEACSPVDVILSNFKMLETLFLPKFTIS